MTLEDSNFNSTSVIVKINKSQYITENLTAVDYGLSEITRVVVTVGGIDYAFNLKPGENFYFILVVNVKGEQYIVTNQDQNDQN